jgi:hypothetical protein
MWTLSQRWYGNRLDDDFRPWTVDDLQQMLSDVGLTTDFWQLRG